MNQKIYNPNNIKFIELKQKDFEGFTHYFIEIHFINGDVEIEEYFEKQLSALSRVEQLTKLIQQI